MPPVCTRTHRGKSHLGQACGGVVSSHRGDEQMAFPAIVPRATHGAKSDLLEPAGPAVTSPCAPQPPAPPPKPSAMPHSSSGPAWALSNLPAKPRVPGNESSLLPPGCQRGLTAATRLPPRLREPQEQGHILLLPRPLVSIHQQHSWRQCSVSCPSGTPAPSAGSPCSVM